jgi:hypothetical protein
VICKARAFPHNFHRSRFWVRHRPTTCDLQRRWEFPSREFSTFNDPHVSCMTLVERRRKPSFQAQVNSRHSYRPSSWLRRLFVPAAILLFALDNILVLPRFIGSFESSTAKTTRVPVVEGSPDAVRSFYLRSIAIFWTASDGTVI